MIHEGLTRFLQPTLDYERLGGDEELPKKLRR
jgi:hypothetical protein